MDRAELLAERDARKAENPLKYARRLRTQAATMLDTRKSVALLGGNWIGKALALDTEIPTPSGFVTMQEIKTGDLVFGIDGKVTGVIGESSVMFDRECFRVVFNDESSVVCDAEHLWETESLKYRKNKARSGDESSSVRRVVTTREIRDTLANRKGVSNHSIRCCGAVEYGAKALPIDPYILGFWLGDGTSGSGAITIGKQDFEETLALLGGIDGYAIGHISGDKREGCTAKSVTITTDGKSIARVLSRAGLLGNKHIPQIYFQGSYEQRLSLVQGLMDTDGCAGFVKAHCEFTSTNRSLADGMVELLCSLGIRPKLSTGRATLYGMDCGEKYRVYFVTDKPVFRLSRKLARLPKAGGHRYDRSKKRYIKAVEAVESVPVKCIKVNAEDGLFLCTRRYIPTHNTEFAAQVVAGIGSHTYPVVGMFPNRPVVMWYVSHPKVFATVQPRIKSYLPTGWLVRTVTESAWVCDKFFGFKDGGYCQFVSWDIDPDSIEGPQVDVAIFDEPPPDIIRRKVLSRVRGDIAKKYYFFTPMAAASELKDALDGPHTDRQRVGLHKAAIWENCKCLAGLSVEKLLRLNKPVSLATEKHVDGCECNGGFKSQEEIVEYLSQWQGLELDAREWGEWMFLHRRILPSFDRQRHVITREWMLKNWGGYFPKHGSLYVILDPHGSRPDFVQFWVAHANETLYLVGELPSFIDGEYRGKLFKDITNYYKPTIEIAKQIVSMLRAINLPVEDMIIDPRKGANPVRQVVGSTHKEIQSFNDALELAGWKTSRFRAISADKDNIVSIEDGHRQINDLLTTVNRITEQPMMMFSELCENTIWAGENYRRQEDSESDGKATNEKPEEKAKDPWDDTRYLLSARPKYYEKDADRIANERADYGLKSKAGREEYTAEEVFAL